MASFLDQLSPEDAEFIRSVAVRRRYPRGSTLFSEGDTSDRVFVISEGHLRISFLTRQGDEVILGIRRAGDMVGELTVLDGSPRSATASAIDEVTALVIGAADLQRLLQERPTFGMAVIKMLAMRLRDSDRKRLELAALPVAGRVASMLLELTEDFGEEMADGTRTSLPVTQQDLAAWTGASREGVTKALQQFRSRGWVETHRRGITVLDAEALRRKSG